MLPAGVPKIEMQSKMFCFNTKGNVIAYMKTSTDDALGRKQTAVSVIQLAGMKIIMDFVPNHSSDQHPWFQSSVQGVGKYRDYYVWKSGKMIPNNATTTTPNNWVWIFSSFGGRMILREGIKCLTTVF